MSILGTTPSPGKIYPGSADEDYLKVFDMTVNNTAVYGTYSVDKPVDPEGVQNENVLQTDVEFFDENVVLATTITDTTLHIQMESDLRENVDDLDGGSF
jgi:hypothetical protein